MLKNACPLAFGTLAHKTHINKTMSGAGTSIRPPPGTAWEGRIASRFHGPIRFPGPKSCENATRHAFRGPGPQSNRHAGRPRRQDDVEMPWAWGSVEKCTPACIFSKFSSQKSTPTSIWSAAERQNRSGLYSPPWCSKCMRARIFEHSRWLFGIQMLQNACGRAS